MQTCQSLKMFLTSCLGETLCKSCIHHAYFLVLRCTFEIPLLQADLGTALPPRREHLRPPVLAHAQQHGPIPIVLVLERPRAAPLAHQHVRREEAVADAGRVEPHLGARGGVDEGRDHFEEGVEQERHVRDERAAQALGICGEVACRGGVRERVSDGVDTGR